MARLVGLQVVVAEAEVIDGLRGWGRGPLFSFRCAGPESLLNQVRLDGIHPSCQLPSRHQRR